MALLPPVANAIIGLEFGPTTVTYEPPAYGSGSLKANFHAESGFSYYPHYHTGRDYAAKEGTVIVAAEAGKVVYSGWDSTGGGEKIAVQIRPGTIYSDNHCERLLVPLGAQVARGQPIATVGATGAAHGYHDHHWLQIDEYVSGVLQHNLWNPKFFEAGGSMANDPRILPLAPPVAKITTLASYSPQWTAIIPPNKTVYGYDPKRPGRWVARYLATPTGSNFPVDKKVKIAWPNPAAYNPVPHGTFLHATAGVFAGLYVPVTSVTAKDGKPW